MLGQRRVAIVQPRPQVGALAGEQAGVQAAAGGHARAVTIAAERRAARTDEADLAGAVVEAVARGPPAAVGGVERGHRPACVDRAEGRRGGEEGVSKWSTWEVHVI